MTNQKRLSRREAIKILGTATGASLLANLPAKWSKPEVTGSVLPAHAQTSGCTDPAIHIELLATNGITFNSNVAPTGPTVLFSTGETISWPCAPCIYVTASIANGAQPFRVTVMGGTPFDRTPSLPISNFSNTWRILLDTSTGNYDEGVNDGSPVTIDGCSVG